MHRRIGVKEVAFAAHAGPAAYLYAARALRDFGDGFVAVLLPVYLTTLGLGRAGGRHRCDPCAVRLGADDIGDRASRRQDGSAQAAHGSVGPDDRDRARVRGVQHLCRRAGGRLHGHHQPVVGQRQHLRSPRARRPLAVGRRRRAHPDVRALWLDRRTGGRSRRARRRQPRLLGGHGRVAPRRAQGHVCRLRGAGPGRRCSVRAHSS